MAAMSLVMATSFPRFGYRPVVLRLRRVFPGTLGQTDDNERSLVHAGDRAGLEVVDGVNTRQFLGAEDCVAQRRAELGRPWLCGVERVLGGVGEDQPGVERISGEAV